MKTVTGTVLVASRDAEFVSEMRLRGVDVDHVPSGQGLLDRLQVPGSVSVLLLDNDLLDVQGTSLVGRIRELDSNVKIIFTVGEFDPELEMEVRREGIHFFLPKPVEWSILEKVLSRVTEKDTDRFLLWSEAGNENTNG